MSAVWNALLGTVEAIREEYLYERKRRVARMSEANRKSLGTCVAGCNHDGEGRRELRRGVGAERLPVRNVVARQDGELSPEEIQASRSASIEPPNSAASASSSAGTMTGIEDDSATQTPDSAIATTTGIVITQTDDNGMTYTTTLDSPTAAVVVLAPHSSVSFNTNDGIPSSTTGLVTSTATDASSTSSSQQDPAPQQSDDSSGGLSQSAKVGLGVGIGVGVPLLLALIAFLIIRRRKTRTRQRTPKYETQRQSDLSMIETPHPVPMSTSREPLHPHHDDVSRSFGSQQYQAYQPPPPPPINTLDNENVFQTPISAVTRSESQTPTSDERLMSRHIPGGPPFLTIPEAAASPLHSRDASIDDGVSPVSPVSPVSAVSQVASRAPSAKQQH